MKRMQNTMAAVLLWGGLCAGHIVYGVQDRIVFGNADSEAAHRLIPGRSEIVSGGLEIPARQLLAPETENWEGGRIAFFLKVDPERQNYVTIRLWGDEVNPNRLVLYCEDKQIGYLHLGDVEILDFGTSEPAYNGRFYYNTNPLPQSLTHGKTELSFEVRSHGPIWRYGGSFEQYQKPMTESSRSIYALYIHTDGYFVPPADEKQGNAPADPPIRKDPGPEVLDRLKERINREITNLLTPARSLSQMQMQFLARAYFVKWTDGYQNKHLVEKVLGGLDAVYAAYRKNPRLAEADPATWNPDWFGLGPSGDVLRLLSEQLGSRLDDPIDDGLGGRIRRREGFSQMLQACCDWHRHNRRLYTNQSMINDLYGIYLANRGIAAIDPANAMPEAAARRYLYESVGLEPWRDSDRDDGESGRRNWGIGDAYMQLTAKGLTKELGYVGTYGEVLDWVVQIYEATRPGLDRPGDETIKAQLVKIALARAPFRYPMLDADGCRAMRLETIIGWRDMHYPGEVVYAQRYSWDGTVLDAAAASLDPHLVGYTQQMFADNQFFKTVEDRMKDRGFRVTAGLLATPDRYERLTAQPPSPHRLPMTASRPDYLFTDEENGVLAMKHGDDVLYASLYWRAHRGVNFLARVHYMTPHLARLATVRQETEFEPGGMTFARRNWIDFGFGTGGHRYPGDPQSAHTGEELPIAKIPDGIRFQPGDESVYAGKGSFYTLRYGPYLIGMNCTQDKTFRLEAAAGQPIEGIDLHSGTPVTLAQKPEVGPMSTRVVYFCTSVSSTITISSIKELVEVAARSGNTVKMTPGVYRMSDYLTDGTAERLNREILSPQNTQRRPDTYMIRFSGSGNTFDLSGVTLLIETPLYRIFPRGYLRSLFITGDNNTVRGLTLRNVGPNAGPADAANDISVFGDNNILEDITLYVGGSEPYGYGDLLGKGGEAIVKLAKHSGVMIGGADTTLRRCKVVSRTMGHCFYIQGGVNTHLEDCYAEGVMRPTSAMLSETSGPAFDRQFASVYENREGKMVITPGYMKSLAEDGFRMYFEGGPKKRPTGQAEFINCTAINTRAGFEVNGPADGRSESLLNGCLALGCERGYLLGGNVRVHRSRGDAAYGPLLYLRGGENTDVELELVGPGTDYTVHALATIAGQGHRVRLWRWEFEPPHRTLPILLGYQMPAHAEMSSPIESGAAAGITLVNATPMPVVISDKAVDCMLQTDGPITANDGRNIQINP